MESKFKQDNDKLAALVKNRVVPLIQEFGDGNVKLNIPPWLKVKPSSLYNVHETDRMELVLCVKNRKLLEYTIIEIPTAEFCSQ